MKILFIASAFNSLCQRAWVELDRLNHQVKVYLTNKPDTMIDAVLAYQPDLIIAPYLKSAIPAIIWSRYTCFIVHPGIPCDRGSSSLDWAILNKEKEWGVTILEATEKMDAGPIWASVLFPMRAVAKSVLYRHEVTQAAIHALLIAIEQFEEKKIVPPLQEELGISLKGRWRRSAQERDFMFSWKDKTTSILRKINAADSSPGACCRIMEQEYYVYGAASEDLHRGEPGSILGIRDHAICMATQDGALWIQCLKKKEDGAIKLPAAIVLGDKAKNISISTMDIFSSNHTTKTFSELKYEEAKEVGYLYFDFYNGAMSTDQCIRLHKAFIAAKQRNTKVIVLMGGEDVWSNGIHLNLIETSPNPPVVSWENINAMDDLIREIICTDSHFIISALQGNAGGGGVSLALASDKVLARKGIVFNPHTRNMGLYGSEYWTYLLPKRIGTQKATLFTEQCLPWGTDIALEVKLIDDCFENTSSEFRQRTKVVAENLAQLSYFPQLLIAKKFKRNRDEGYKPLSQYREEELEKMHKNFFEDDLGYDYKRYCFVHKIYPEVKMVREEEKDLYSERRKIWRRRKYEKLFYEA